MAELTGAVLSHLKELAFEVRAGQAMPFGELLPLVSGLAWETRTAQLAMIAEGQAPLEIEAWRQLLFAGSGIRHQLAGDDASAFGTPVVVAIVDDAGAGELRALAEELAQDSAVFNRVDLNLVRERDIGNPERLDDALASLLPRCRRLLGQEISRAEVQEFWGLLRGEVEKAARELDNRFGEQRAIVGTECANDLIGDSAHIEELPSPMPIARIDVRHLRSIEEASVGLADVSVIHGPNGSGKTTLVEAMEIAWAGRSQRMPPDVELADYVEHLPRGGEGRFTIECDGEPVAVASESQRAQLNRCVLTHEAIAGLVNRAPQERFSALLEVTGLEIPDLKSRTERLLRHSKAVLDSALSAAGMPGLNRANAVGLKHLDGELKSELAHDYAALVDLGRLEAALASVAENYRPRQWAAGMSVLERLEQADRAVARAVTGELDEEQLAEILDRAGETVGELLAERSQAAGSARALLEALREQVRAERSAEPHSEEAAEPGVKDAPLDAALAARWLSSSRSLQSEAKRFRQDAARVRDDAWRTHLRDYAEAVERAAEIAPHEELERLSKPAVRALVVPAPKLGKDLLGAAGFDEGDVIAEEIGPLLRELSDALDDHVIALRRLVERLESHPARLFGHHRESVMSALCRFELARALRREGPILQASEQLVCRLLDKRMAPIVRELMAAIVRFEWYFKPLEMSSDGRRVVLSGLATERNDLDARLLLNSAERAVLGLAWFLALHMLQPEERRKVLVMDDPTAGLDSANTAGFASTLRAFARLLRPAQVVVTTHDERVAAMLGEELAQVDGWPQSVVRVRFSRDAEDRSVATEEWAREGTRRLAREFEELGLIEEPSAR